MPDYTPKQEGTLKLTNFLATNPETFQLTKDETDDARRDILEVEAGTSRGRKILDGWTARLPLLRTGLYERILQQLVNFRDNYAEK